MSRALSVALVLLAVGVATGQGAGGREGKEVVDQVFAAWKAMRAKAKSVRYEVSGEVITPKGAIGVDEEGTKPLAVPVPKSDVSEPQHVTVLLDFVVQRFRFERDRTATNFYNGQSRQRRSVTTYDGKEFWHAWKPGESGRPAEEPDASVSTGNMRPTAFPYEDFPYFLTVTEFGEGRFACGNRPTRRTSGGSGASRRGSGAG